MGGPDRGKRAESTGSFDIANDTADDHRRSLVINLESLDNSKEKTYLDDGDGLNDLFLVHLGARTIEVSHNMCHTGLVSGKGSEVD